VSEAVIRINDISLSFGGVNALSNVSLDVRRDEILAIIGPNGAGKTAVLRLPHMWGWFRFAQNQP
jgi:branched-chain amino acid transport system ATP-binding protein